MSVVTPPQFVTFLKSRRARLAHSISGVAMAKESFGPREFARGGSRRQGQDHRSATQKLAQDIQGTTSLLPARPPHRHEDRLRPRPGPAAAPALAQKEAVARRLPGEGLLAHCDRGSQYASDHYQRLLQGHGIRCSLSRRGNCWDNAPRESFFASLKKELIQQEDSRSRAEPRASVFEYIELLFYNRVR
jgi:hypothetical protein